MMIILPNLDRSENCHYVYNYTVSTWPGCCGALIAHFFRYNTEASPVRKTMFKDDWLAELSKFVSFCHRTGGMLLINVADRNDGLFGRLMTACNYPQHVYVENYKVDVNKSAEFRNPNSGNYICIWTFTPIGI